MRRRGGWLRWSSERLLRVTHDASGAGHEGAREPWAAALAGGSLGVAGAEAAGGGPLAEAGPRTPRGPSGARRRGGVPPWGGRRPEVRRRCWRAVGALRRGAGPGEAVERCGWLCRLCPGEAEWGAKGRREVAWMGLWGLFWAIFLYSGPLSRITRYGNFKQQGSSCTFTNCARSCALTPRRARAHQAPLPTRPWRRPRCGLLG